MDLEKQLALLLEAAKLDQKIREADLDKPPTPLEVKTELIRLREDKRKAAGKRRAAEKRKRRLRLAKGNRYHQRQYVQRWDKAAEGDWWPIVRTTWRKRKLKVELTEAEWNINVSPHIPEGCVFDVRRIDTNRGISLDNIMLINHNKVVLFDGSNHGLLG